jgi:hypothetical protein
MRLPSFILKNSGRSLINNENVKDARKRKRSRQSGVVFAYLCAPKNFDWAFVIAAISADQPQG